MDYKISSYQNDNINNLKKVNTLQNNVYEYISIYSDLTEIQKTLKTISSEFKEQQSLYNIQNEHRKLIKTYGFFLKLRKKYKLYLKKQMLFDKKSQPFTTKWNDIEQNVAVFLDVTDDLIISLNNTKYNGIQFHPYIQKKIEDIRTTVTKADKQKRFGNFEELRSVFDNLRQYGNKLIEFFYASEKLDFALYAHLSSLINSKINQKQDVDFYTKLSKSWKKQTEEWKKQDTLVTIDKVKKIYKVMFIHEIETNKINWIKSYLLDNKEKIQNLLENINQKLLSLNLSGKSNKDDFSNLKTSVENLYKDSKSADDLLEKTSEVLKKFEQIQINIYRQKQNQREAKIYGYNKEIIRIQNIYYSLISNENLPKTKSIQIKKEHIRQEFEHFNKNKFKLIYTDEKQRWNNWISSIINLIKVLSENLEYKKMYDALSIYIMENPRFENKKNESKNQLFNLKINIENNEYKISYFKLKNYLKTS
ncbi:hypothetical protein ACR82Z_03025 [Mycoplasma sp. 6243]|uniref:hypothetical protein n=1 Tax=Mycoplasma sp. 6243 TaxID=3440865 RepID=UPI003EBCED28